MVYLPWFFVWLSTILLVVQDFWDFCHPPYQLTFGGGEKPAISWTRRTLVDDVGNRKPHFVSFLCGFTDDSSVVSMCSIAMFVMLLTKAHLRNGSIPNCFPVLTCLKPVLWPQNFSAVSIQSDHFFGLLQSPKCLLFQSLRANDKHRHRDDFRNAAFRLRNA